MTGAIIEIATPEYIVIEDAGDLQVIEITAETTEVVEVAEQGPAGPPGAAGAQGPQGIPGLSGANYVHNQAVPSADWTITHNLARFPSVTVIDSAGSTVVGDVEYLSNNQVAVHFTAAFGGSAYLN